MNFFRLRFLNTLLLFFIGIVLGFIIKERFYPSARPAAPAPYQHPGASAVSPGTYLADDAEDVVEEGAVEGEEEPEPLYAARDTGARQPAPPAGAELVIEPRKPAPAALPLKVGEEEFFSRPNDYAGRELELSLQMITAARSAGNWRLNLVHTGASKKLDYLYLDDQELLGEAPDLRIGYVYKVRFLCSKGDPSSGNTLLAIEPTGAKAQWATGLSATE